ncbi:uncharacterized protein DUF3150 [Modicisalibacter xianhensis]|uniref:Uncharacterized protein DUF3150 n=1 Tax=Modicisalibacter xianhensis TaxID=442341 RepID=A0A4R8FKR7_9GAMM|nr:DUF3150 domain-containing protein [Halomonas xianhensis]TDX26784.1 uncharacterized protein DUF3150 [Halomonas xianhensis]
MSNTSNRQIQHLENLCVIHVDFDIWSGQTRLNAEDLKLGEGGEIPPEKLALLGSKKICDPAKLRGFHRLKTKCRRKLEHYGLPFMNGWAVPAERLDTILKQLDSIGKEFDAVRQEFLRCYDKAVDDWANDNPGYEHIIRAGAMPRDVVETRIGFDYQVFQIQPVGDVSDATQQRLNRKVGGLSNALFDEITAEANKFYEERLKGAMSLDISTRKTLENLRNKVDGLSFLHGALAPLVQLLDETIQGYQQHAQGRYVVAPFLYQVMAAVLIMRDRGMIASYANGAVSVDDMAQNAGSLAIGLNPDALAAKPDQSVATATETDADDSQATDENQDGDEELAETSASEAVPANVSEPEPEPELDTSITEIDVDEVCESPAKQDDLLADMDRFFAQYGTESSPEAEPDVDSKAAIPVSQADPVNDETGMVSHAEPAPEATQQPAPMPITNDEDDWGAW